MPNWSSCSNVIRGEKSVIQDIRDKMLKYGFEINKEFTTPAISLVTSYDIGNFSKQKCSQKRKFKSKKTKPKQNIHSFKSNLSLKVKNWRKSNPDWYGWRLANWGTKWNMLLDENSRTIDEVRSLNINESEFRFFYTGAWAGAYIWFIRLCAMYNLSGTYEDLESGCNFYHKIVCEDGEVISNEEDGYMSDLSIKELGTEYFIEEYEGCFESIYECSDIIDILVAHGCNREEVKERLIYNELVS